ncbi:MULTISPECIES: DUF2231 domain-containing protein [unclassified Caballeronia]|uniref:DUF2231 domain-containing protein n=1 Tax=unclassified Caballeronia TaxID=2646786 RepID=UPI002859E966|nr:MULTISPECIES: DUF2231 domain-containing protein [unclassified Caballeronia]MDR5755176.1 hypothetical protein [Caballeronia sp. LZ024]MDR5845349.1 hypothetical protein [Caballeronia sp. LZ031]
MSTTTAGSTRLSVIAHAVFQWLDPIPYGLFVGALIFDITYATARNVFWGKSAAWLLTAGLMIAIIPRLLNLGHVWFQRRRPISRAERIEFWLTLFGIIAAIVNAFVHSRDAYAMVPENVILSVVTVLLMSIGHIAIAIDRLNVLEAAHE